MWLDVFNANPYGTNCWLLSAEGSDEAIVVDPGFSPHAVHGAARCASGKSGRRGARSPTPTSITSVKGGDFAGEMPVFVHGPTRSRSPTTPAWNAGFDNPLAPVKDLRTLADGDVLRLAGSRSTWCTRRVTRPATACFRVDADACSRATWSSRVDRAIGLPELGPRRDAARACAVPQRCPTRLPVLPGHGPDTTVGRERASNPFLRELGLMELAPPRGTQDLLPDRADAMLGLYDDAHRGRSPLRVPVRRDAHVRAHRAVHADVRRDVRRGDEGDVHVRGQGRAFAHPAPGEHGGRRARLPDARRRRCRTRSRAITSPRSSATAVRRRGACASSASSASR